MIRPVAGYDYGMLSAGGSVRRLGVAPHRLMFFAGVTNIMLAMLWWTAWLVSSRWPQLFLMRYPPVFPGWLHAASTFMRRTFQAMVGLRNRQTRIIRLLWRKAR